MKIINKKCSCGKVHNEVPKNAREWKDEGVLIGWVWECECKSTLFVPTFNLKSLLAKAV